MKISVVTAYYNRKQLFYHTLLRLRLSVHKDFEVIAVDDGSNEENRLEDLQNEFDFLKVIRIEPTEKWYTNACIPFNKGIQAAKGDIIMLQNPECIHYGDVLKYVADNLQSNDYFSFGAYSLDKKTTENITPKNAISLESLQIPFIAEAIYIDGDAGWYNHSICKPRGFHWCSAIFKKEINALGGFDEQFALGIAFDDNELLERINKKRMNCKIIDEPFVLHQHHFDVDTRSNKSIHALYSRKDAGFLLKKNEHLFTNYTIKHKQWVAKKRSRLQIKYFDFILTCKLKFIKEYRFISWRIKNKWSRLWHKASIKTFITLVW